MIITKTLIKGWFFILIFAASLVGIVWLSEQAGNEAADTNPQPIEPPAQTLPAGTEPDGSNDPDPATAPITAPAENNAAEQPLDKGNGSEVTTGVSDEGQPTPEQPISPPKETQTPQTQEESPAPDTSNTGHQDTPPEKTAAVETTDAPPPETGAADQTAATTSVEPPAETVEPQPEQAEERCRILDQGVYTLAPEEMWAEMPSPPPSIEIPLNSGATVKSMTGGTVMKITESPFTGKSIYILNDRGDLCLLYGRLDRIAVAVGDAVACGAPLGTISAEAPAKRLHLATLAVKPGDAWWRHRRVDPRPFIVESLEIAKPLDDQSKGLP